MTRLLFTLLLPVALTAFVPAAPAAPVPKASPDGTKDREGNPLPKGATARLGSLAFRKPTPSYGLWYSADGTSLYSWDREKVIGWDAKTGKRLERGPFPLGQKFAGHIPVAAGGRLISFEETYGPTGRLLVREAVVTGADGKVLSRIDCTSLGLGPISPVAPANFAVSRDGTRAAHVADDRTVRAFDLTTGKEIFKEKIGAGQLTGVVLAPDGKTLFVQEVSKNVRRFSLPDGKELSPLTIAEGRLSALVASADGTLAVTAVAAMGKTPGGGRGWISQSFVVVHDLATGKVRRKIEPGGRPGIGPLLGSDAIILVSAVYRAPGPPRYTLARWNLKTLQKEWEAQDGDGILLLSPDGKRLAISGVGSIRILDPATGKRLDTVAAHGGPVAWIGFSADGETVTTQSREVMTWTRAGERKAVAEPPELRDAWVYGNHTNNPRAWVSFSADGKTRELVGWDFEKHKVAWRMPLGADLSEKVFTHDGKRVIGAAFDAKQSRWEVTMYDGPAGKKAATWTVAVAQGQPQHPAMVLSGDGKTLFGFDGDIVGRDPETGKEKVRVKTGPVAVPGGSPFPAQVATTFDAARIAVVQQEKGRGGGTLRVFEVKTGKELAAHALGRAYFPGFAFDPTGMRVAVWNVEDGVLVCDAKGTAEPRKLRASDTYPSCAAFSPNGASLGVGYQDGTSLIWDLSAK